MSDTDIVTRLVDALLYESWGETSALPEAAAAEILRLRSLNAELVEALEQISRMTVTPDGVVVRMTLVAARMVAEAALSRATKESDHG